MGAVAGIVRFDLRPVERDELLSMATRTGHRAVDGQSLLVDGSVGLISQLTRTSPHEPREPEVIVTRHAAIVFDGHLANRNEIRRSLPETSDLVGDLSDAALVARGWDEWGIDLPRRLNGVFALAIWDRRERSLLLARDALGVRPLFVLESPGAVAFSSEVASFLALASWSPAADEDGVSEYLSFRPASSRRTLYRGVSRVMPGEAVLARGGMLRRWFHWTGEPRPPLRMSDSDCEEAFRTAFGEAVRVSHESCGPVAAYLSGGIDSSSNVCMAASLSLPVDAYSLVLPGRDCDESEFIDAVVASTGIRSHRLEPATRTLADVISETASSCDTATTPNFAMANSLRARMREAGIRVALSGEGGDEWFSGLDDREAALATLRARHLRELSAHYSAASIAGGIVTAAKRGIPAAAARVARRLSGRNGAPPPVPWLTAGMRSRALELAAAAEPCGAMNGWPLVVLEAADRTTSRHGFEERFPWYDQKLVELSLSLASYQLRRNGATKWVVRQALRDVLPGKVANRRDKAGFDWVIRGAVAPLRELLPELRLAQRGWIDVDVAAATLDRVTQTGEWEGIRLWTVLALECWIRILDG